MLMMMELPETAGAGAGTESSTARETEVFVMMHVCRHGELHGHGDDCPVVPSGLVFVDAEVFGRASGRGCPCAPAGANK